MRTIQELMKTVQPGRKVFVRAEDLGMDEETFHTLATGWLEKPEGFSVVGEPHHEKDSGLRRIDVIWLMRNID
jgi:hypothetical protein